MKNLREMNRRALDAENERAIERKLKTFVEALSRSHHYSVKQVEAEARKYEVQLRAHETRGG